MTQYWQIVPAKNIKSTAWQSKKKWDVSAIIAISLNNYVTGEADELLRLTWQFKESSITSKAPLLAEQFILFWKTIDILKILILGRLDELK